MRRSIFANITRVLNASATSVEKGSPPIMGWIVMEPVPCMLPIAAIILAVGLNFQESVISFDMS
jgi:hypothetical protein